MVVGVLHYYLVAVVDWMERFDPYFSCSSVLVELGVGASSHRCVDYTVIGHGCCSAKCCCIDERAVVALYAVRAVDALVDAVHNIFVGNDVAVVTENSF